MSEEKLENLENSLNLNTNIELSLKEFIENGVHFGHQAQRWNPKMAPYIFGVRNGVHIIDLDKTLPIFESALNALKQCVANCGKVLFVSTVGKETSAIVSSYAQKCGMPYVTSRWLGGTLTNWNVISASIKKLKELEVFLENNAKNLTKKELLSLWRKKQKLDLYLRGIRDMDRVPDMVLVLSAKTDQIALTEAMHLKIPTVAIVDTNASPENITYAIPANDDALKANDLYCRLFTEAIFVGMQASMDAMGYDMGAATDINNVTSRSDRGERTDKRGPNRYKRRTVSASVDNAGERSGDKFVGDRTNDKYRPRVPRGQAAASVAEPASKE